MVVRATSWDSGVFIQLSCCCIYVAGLIEAGCLLPPGWCIDKLLPDLDILSAMSMSFHVCTQGGGVDLPTCGGWVGGGVNLMV